MTLRLPHAPTRVLLTLAALTLPALAVAQATPAPRAAAPAAGTSTAAKPEMHAFGAWVRATPPGSTMTAAYVSFHNPQSGTDRLLGAATPAAKRVEIHETRMANGVAQMRRVDGLDVRADEAVKFAPGGLHLMLMDLAGPLQAGQKIPLQLRFRNAGTVEVQATVRAATDTADAKAGGHAHH